MISWRWIISDKGTLVYLVERLQEWSGKSDVSEDHLWYSIRGAVNPGLLIANLAEASRLPAKEMERVLIESGFGDLVAQERLARSETTAADADEMEYSISANHGLVSPFPDIFSIECSPPLSQPIRLSSGEHGSVMLLVKSLTSSVDEDPFAELYRRGVREYREKFMASEAPLIDRFLADEFSGGRPTYVVNSGIGANEQFNHLLAHLNNNAPDRKVTWLIIDSPRHLTKLPADATISNTLFMEFSRSGKTEETVKIHEYTPREAKRIVFANSGPLREIGLRDRNLVLNLPDQVSGRFGRNKTPILLAPMHVAGMDARGFWKNIEETVTAFDLSSPASLPLQISLFIYLYQQRNGINHIYLGCNDDVLSYSADELLQFWNEGVNKDGNDISMSRYFGLLRDSHATVEGLLSNYKTKMALFLLREVIGHTALPVMTSSGIDPIDLEHAGLSFGDEERILAEANYQRFSEVMPTIKLLVRGELTLKHAAVLGQLWADVTFCYSRLKNVDPGSNPEVKYVRDRSALLLAESASRKRRSKKR